MLTHVDGAVQTVKDVVAVRFRFYSVQVVLARILQRDKLIKAFLFGSHVAPCCTRSETPKRVQGKLRNRNRPRSYSARIAVALHHATAASALLRCDLQILLAIEDHRSASLPALASDTSLGTTSVTCRSSSSRHTLFPSACHRSPAKCILATSQPSFLMLAFGHLRNSRHHASLPGGR